MSSTSIEAIETFTDQISSLNTVITELTKVIVSVRKDGDTVRNKVDKILSESTGIKKILVNLEQQK